MLVDPEQTISVDTYIPWGPCNTDDQKNILKTGDSEARPYDIHCKKPSCWDNCNPMISKYRGQALRKQLMKEHRVTVWIGEFDREDINSLTSYAQKHPEIKRVTTLYRDVDARVILATHNMRPQKNKMLELPVRQAIDLWFTYAYRYKLRRSQTKDWTLDLPTLKEWIVEATVEENRRVLIRMYDTIEPEEFVNRALIGDKDFFVRKYRAILMELRSPRDPTDLYG